MSNLPLTVDDWRFKDDLRRALLQAVYGKVDDISMALRARTLDDGVAAVIRLLKETKPSFEDSNVKDAVATN